MIYRIERHGEEGSEDEVGRACDRYVFEFLVGRCEGRDNLEHTYALIG